MKARTLLGSLASALFLFPATTPGQDTGAPGKHSQKPRTVAALVSADAKSFRDPKQAQWTAANPEALSGFENQRVKVSYLESGEAHRARILSVEAAPASSRNTAYKTDSAYRR
jgi:hypothetical protein